jgi:hypothetical protein
MNMKRFCARHLASLALFGLILAASSASAAPNIVFVSPTDNGTVDIGWGSAKMKVIFKTNNGFAPLTADLSLNGGASTTEGTFSYDGITAEYTAEFAVSPGIYPNSSVTINVRRQGNSGGAKPDEDTLSVTGVTVQKAAAP